MCATVEVCEQTLKTGEVRLGLNMGNKEDGEAHGGNGKSKVRLPGCTVVSLPPFFAFVLVWSFTTPHINVNWYSFPFLNFFQLFFSSQQFHFQFTPSYYGLPACSHMYLLHSWHVVCPLQCFQYIHPLTIKVLSSCYCVFLNLPFGTSLVVQWLRLCAPKARGLGLIPGQGTGPHRPQLGVQGSQPRIPQATTRTRCHQINK